ncbi:MAG: polysaccharide deacetylase family protein [Legionella sp.]|nr:polysaccharide deacetylase family protein [Legionella sp.]
MSIRRLGVALVLYIAQSSCFAIEHEIAITIDDLPFVGSGTNTPSSLKRTQDRFMAIVNVLVAYKIPATGFAIGGAVAKNEWDLLETFRNQGFNLGNHTYTHWSLNSTNTDKYIADIDRADKVLTRVMTEPKYFRFPYLAEGSGAKKQKVRDYLDAHKYIIAPVTIDSKDYEFNARLYKIAFRNRERSITQFKKGYLAYIWKQTLRAERNTSEGRPAKQILLIHANLLNSMCLEDIIQMYQKNGYKFISLAEALEGNTAPAITNESSIPTIPNQNGINQPHETIINKNTSSFLDTYLEWVKIDVVSIASNILYFSYGRP